jgi:hypothetical protein
MSQRIADVSAKVARSFYPPAPDDGQRPFGLFGTIDRAFWRGRSALIRCKIVQFLLVRQHPDQPLPDGHHRSLGIKASNVLGQYGGKISRRTTPLFKEVDCESIRSTPLGPFYDPPFGGRRAVQAPYIPAGKTFVQKPLSVEAIGRARRS